MLYLKMVYGFVFTSSFSQFNKLTYIAVPTSYNLYTIHFIISVPHKYSYSIKKLERHFSQTTLFHARPTLG